MSYPMGNHVALEYAEKFLKSFSGPVPDKRIQNYALRIARFDENTASGALEWLTEHCRACPSIAEMLDELHKRAPHVQRVVSVGYPPGLDPEATHWRENGIEYTRMPRSERRRYLAAERKKREAVLREPKSQKRIDKGREAATSWMRQMLNKNPWRKCDSCGKEIGAVANLTKFIEKCAQARWGDPIDGRLECDECAA